ncbi:MAG TPA: hypothetical protein VKO18_05715 [Terriglobia bacterium]|nr:hypothetical protein [Terriglobia bacterium]
MAWSDGVAIASIASLDFIAIAAIILATMVVATLILVSSTALFFFYLLAVAQRILRVLRYKR